ncbi:MAG: FAD-dependent oxidoreductase [Candidatus Methanomethylicia archaeon]
MSIFLSEKPLYDVVIIGAGPAGLTAGIYCANMGFKTLVIEGSSPSRLQLAGQIHNYPGFPDGISGSELLNRIRIQALNAGAELRRGDVVAIDLLSPVKTVITRTESITTFTVIIAVGLGKRKLNIEGEDRLLGLGVSYCALCDGPLYKGKTVALVSDELSEDLLSLSRLASKIYFIPLKPLGGVSGLPDNVEVINVKVKAINGVNKVEGLRIIKNGVEEILQVDGVFISTQTIPFTSIIAKSGVEVDERGCIKVGKDMTTNIEGVYAAGDCTCGGMQVAVAVGQGALAAIRAIAYIHEQQKELKSLII